MFSVIYNPGKQITAVINGESHTANADHPNFTKMIEAWKNKDADGFLKLVDIPASIKLYTSNKISIKDGFVYYGNSVLHNTLTERILAFMNEGLPFQPLLNFLENLVDNPSKRAVDELYNFLEKFGITITEDGYFLAYKRVRDDWYDFHSGTILNSIGSTITVPRNSVNEDWGQACAEGLHVGAIEYVQGFNTGGHILIVKVNPRDVVSVPMDASFTKCRVCEYQIIKEYEGDLVKPLYTANAQEWVGQADEWDSECDECDEDDTVLEAVEVIEEAFESSFYDGEYVTHKSDDSVVYPVVSDSFIRSEDGREYMKVRYAGTDYEVLASDYILSEWEPDFLEGDTIIHKESGNSYVTAGDSFVGHDGREYVQIVFGGVKFDYLTSQFELLEAA